MAIAFVQYDDYWNLSVGGTVANDTALNTTSGNLLVVVVGAWDATPDACIITGISDTAGNTYTKAIGEFRAGINTSEREEIWYAKNITGNANNVTTATFTDTAGYRYISVSEFSGVDTSSPLDDTEYFSCASKTSHSSGDATASASGALIVGGYNADQLRNMTVGDGFTTLSSDLSAIYEMAEYKILGAAGDYAATFTSSDVCSSINVCAIFKATSVTNVTVSPSALSLALSQKAPSFVLDVLLTPVALTLTLVQKAPSWPEIYFPWEPAKREGFTMASKDHLPIEPHYEIHLSEQNNAFRGKEEDKWMRGKEQGPMEYDVNDPLQPLLPSVKRNKNNKLAMHLENLKNERTLVQ